MKGLFEEAGTQAIFIPAQDIANEVGNILSINMVMMGAFVATSKIVETESVVLVMREEIQQNADINVEAFWKGFEFISGKDYN